MPAGHPNYNPELESLSLSQIKDFCIDLEKATFAKSKEIENIPYLGGDTNNETFVIANSKGALYTV